MHRLLLCRCCLGLPIPLNLPLCLNLRLPLHLLRLPTTLGHLRILVVLLFPLVLRANALVVVVVRHGCRRRRRRLKPRPLRQVLALPAFLFMTRRCR